MKTPKKGFLKRKGSNQRRNISNQNRHERDNDKASMHNIEVPQDL